MQFLEIPLGITCHIEPPEQGVINTYYTEDNLCLTVYSQRASLNSCLVKMVKIIWKIGLVGGGGLEYVRKLISMKTLNSLL